MTEQKVKLPLGDDGKVIEQPDESKVKPDEAKPDAKPDETKPEDKPEEVVVSIDGSDYKLDKEGNALKDDGTVFMTKEEMDKLAEEAGDDQPGEKEEDIEVDVTIEDIEKASGIELRDRDGNKIEFPLTVEGLAKREKYIKDLGLNEGKSQAITEFFKSNPDLYKAYKYKEKQGTLDGFTNKPYYSSIQVNTEDEQQLKQLVVEAELKRGKTPEAAKRYAEYCKAENILEEEGVNAHKALVALEEAEETNDSKIKEDNRKAQLEKEKKYFGTYYDEKGKEVIVDTPGSIYNKVVTKGQFGNLAIPEEGITVKNKDGNPVKVSRRQIFDYVSTPVEGDKFNRSQAEIDLDNRFNDMDYRLRQYMMNLTGNDLSVFLERQVLESKSKNIKRILKTSSARVQDDVNKQTGDKRLKVPVK